MEKRPGIIGYIVQDGDDLWELAKRYSTTMEGIMEVNQMENSDLKSGDKILIFKENMSILYVHCIQDTEYKVQENKRWIK